jgi:hypothetical protein
MPGQRIFIQAGRLVLMMLIVAVMPVACTSNDDEPASGTASRQETVQPQETLTVQQSRDLAGYPMPANLVGQERLPGVVGFQTRDPAKGSPGTLFFSTVDDTLLVTVCSMNVNCCTQKIEPSFTITKTGADVVLYEYLPDVCECFRGLDVSFRIYPALASGTSLQVFANGKPAPVASGTVE